MKIDSALVLTLTASLLLLSTVADARLIKRGGASTDLGSGGAFHIAPIGIGNFILDGNPNVVELGYMQQIQTDPVPFANRSGEVGSRDPDDVCNPIVCDFVFSLNDPLTIEGHSISFGADKGVMTSFKWSLYNPPSTVINSNGDETTTRGTRIDHWEPEPTNIDAVDNVQIDVWLDTFFPVNLAPGLYQLGLTSTYTAPVGMEFGYLDPNSVLLIGGGRSRSWKAQGNSFSTSTFRRYNLSLEASTEVSAPNQFSILGLIMGLLICSRVKSTK